MYEAHKKTFIVKWDRFVPTEAGVPEFVPKVCTMIK